MQHPIEQGSALDDLEISSVDAEKMKTMAVILRDPNPIHWDVDLVRELGMGDRVVNQGPNNMAYLVELLARNFGGEDLIVNLKVRFLANVFSGDRLIAGGVVNDVRAAGRARLAEVELWLRRDGNEHDLVMSGTAQVRLA
jgi:acyl dehydratase